MLGDWIWEMQICLQHAESCTALRSRVAWRRAQREISADSAGLHFSSQLSFQCELAAEGPFVPDGRRRVVSVLWFSNPACHSVSRTVSRSESRSLYPSEHLFLFFFPPHLRPRPWNELFLICPSFIYSHLQMISSRS